MGEEKIREADAAAASARPDAESGKREVGQVVVHCPLCTQRIIAARSDSLFRWYFACGDCRTQFQITGLGFELTSIQKTLQPGSSEGPKP
jgi:hypothetical protein